MKKLKNIFLCGLAALFFSSSANADSKYSLNYSIFYSGNLMNGISAKSKIQFDGRFTEVSADYHAGKNRHLLSGGITEHFSINNESLEVLVSLMRLGLNYNTGFSPLWCPEIGLESNINDFKFQLKSVFGFNQEIKNIGGGLSIGYTF